MGKKSLLAPTSKEKTGSGKRPEKEEQPLTAPAAAKKAAPKPKKKKPAAAAAAKKKAASRKTAKRKTIPKKSSQKKKAPAGSASTAKSSAKPKAPKTAAVKKKPAVKKKSAAKKKPAAKKKSSTVSVRDLLKRKYNMPVSGKKYSPPPVRKGSGEISSPPFFVGETKEETERVRQLLFKKFDSAGKTDSGKAAASSKTSWMDGYLQLQLQEKKKPMDPMQKTAVIGLSVLAVLLIMVLWTSASNNGKFYVKPVDGQIEIWEGRFSPKGRDKIFTFSSIYMPAELEAVYSRKEAYPIIFDGILAEADALLGVEETPDFEHIRRSLEIAEPYAVSREMSERLQRRLDKINMMALVYKANILAGKGTVEDLVSARESLEEALLLELDEAEKGLIQHQISWVDQRLEEAAED